MKVIAAPKVIEIEQVTEEYCKKIDRDPTITYCALGTERNRVDMGKCQGGGSEEGKAFKMKDVEMLKENCNAKTS